jgi:hypothetical protein
VALSFAQSPKPLLSNVVQSTVGKKKQKEKDKPADNDRPRRKELAREVERLEAQNEALRARLERIAEIANSDHDKAAESSIPVLDTPEQ